MIYNKKRKIVKGVTGLTHLCEVGMLIRVHPSSSLVSQLLSPSILTTRAPSILLSPLAHPLGVTPHPSTRPPAQDTLRWVHSDANDD